MRRRPKQARKTAPPMPENWQAEGWQWTPRGELASPEGNVYTPGDMQALHWRLQICAVIRYRLNRPEQFTLF